MIKIKFIAFALICLPVNLLAINYSMPLGIYTDTCESIRVDKNLLCGNCKNDNGNKLIYSCVPFFSYSFIMNVNGILTDNNANTQSDSIYQSNPDNFDKMLQVYPTGTYGASCKNILLYPNNNLCAECVLGTNSKYEEVYKKSCISYIVLVATHPFTKV